MLLPIFFIYFRFQMSNEELYVTRNLLGKIMEED
jgi:hypothetical protein